MKKSDLAERAANAIRFNQNLADRYDEAVCKRLGITPTEFRCIDIITQRAKITPGELVRDAGISAASGTNVIDRLEARGWIERSPDPDDRRRTLVRATALAGEEVFRYYRAFYENFMAELAKLSMSELEMLASFFERGNVFTEHEIARLENRP